MDMEEEAFEQEPARTRKNAEEKGEPNKNNGAFPAEQQHNPTLLLDYGVGSAVEVLPFDCSVQNHFEAMDAIAKLCGGDDSKTRLEDTELARLASKITFLREWRHLNYGPRTIKFASEVGSSSDKGVSQSTILSQFSSSTVPKEDQPQERAVLGEPNKDFVMYVGGLVWALDWCPLPDWRADCQVRCEFIAVAAHPPGSSYHKLGCPITGRGAVQIWSLLNVIEDEKKVHSTQKNRIKIPDPPSKPRGRPKKNLIEGSSVQINSGKKISHKSTKVMNDQPKKPRGRPRKERIEGPDQPKKPRKKTVGPPDVSDLKSQFLQIAPVQFPSDAAEQIISDEVVEIDQGHSLFKDSGKKDNFDAMKERSTQSRKRRGRTRKKCVEEPSDENNVNGLFVKALAVQFPEGVCEQTAFSEVPENAEGPSINIDSVNNRKSCEEKPFRDSRYIKVYTRRRKRKGTTDTKNDKSLSLVPMENVDKGDATNDQHGHFNSREGTENCNGAAKNSTIRYIRKDVALPRLVLCLAHNGKVAWDVKWRPTTVHESKRMQTMGYLAVILGDGSLEVWEVPLPSTVKDLYSCMGKEGTDPRFVELEPVFRCSKLKSGEIQSIPVTVEWSSSSPQEYLLAGCHDGTVALWKFCPSDSTKDTRPLLCFSADTDPIRALAWSPTGRETEGANVIVTAGQGGIKFWDLRDPFRPLWHMHPVPRNIYSLDWVPDLRCVIMSFDDGSLKFLSLSNSAYDVPVTGKRHVGTKQPGLHNYHCSSFPIWSVHVSRGTGMVAYSCANGSVCHFQLTSKAVDKESSRYRAPHYSCVSMTEEEDSTISINTAESEIPVSVKKPLSKPTTVQAKAAVVVVEEENGDGKRVLETFPPKVVAMNRVRWNMNRGSERWMCYGGGAGIVLCQRIAVSDFHHNKPKS